MIHVFVDVRIAHCMQACGDMPGFMYLALGDPLQKRNFYRAGWLRFTDEADMAPIMADLAEKKVWVSVSLFTMIHTHKPG